MCRYHSMLKDFYYIQDSVCLVFSCFSGGGRKKSYGAILPCCVTGLRLRSVWTFRAQSQLILHNL